MFLILRDYSSKLGQVMKACKVQNINANIKKLQDDIINEICIDDIIENLHKYI